MKRTLSLILAFLLIALLCSCGASETSQTTTEPEKTPEPMPTAVPYEKADGQLSEEIYYNADGLRYMTLRYEYDAEGRVKKELTLGVNEAPQSYTAYAYDADGRLLKESCFVAVDAENFEPDGECVYEYNADGLCTGKSSTTGGFESSFEYEYNAEKLVSEEKCCEGGELICILSYTYDANGNNIKLVRRSVMTETESVTETEFDADGRALNVSSDDGRYSYTYNERGDEVRMNCFDSDGTLKYSRLTEYEYDEAGNIIKSTVSSDNGSFAGTVTEFVWLYAKG